MADKPSSEFWTHIKPSDQVFKPDALPEAYVAKAAGLVNRHDHPHEVFAYTISGKWGYLEHDCIRMARALRQGRHRRRLYRPPGSLRTTRSRRRS